MERNDKDREDIWREGVERKLATLQGGQGRLVGDVQTLKGDVQTLTSDVQELKRGQQRLEKGLQRLEKWQQGTEKWQQGTEKWQQATEKWQQATEKWQQGTDTTMAFMVKTLDRYQAENRRYLEVLIEQTRSERSTQGEGIRANRERLDDHELRIRGLEAS